MDIYYENDFKEINSPIIVSKREASRKTPGCGINMHEYVEFYYIITGGIEVFCNGASEWIYPGDIAFINWCQPHKSLCFLDDTLYYIVQFDLNSLSCGNYDVFQTKYVTRLISDTGLFKTYFREDKILKSLFETLVYEYENKLFTYELSVQAAIFNILAIIINSAEDQ
ncbi:MAG: AraC family transcriptional regulator [Oscillospiraceae bacterium]|nr:AraC family transcriptional regulator [Oscillospiraceae bacterium]